MAAYTTDVREYFKVIIITNRLINYSNFNRKYQNLNTLLKFINFLLKILLFLSLLNLSWCIIRDQTLIDGVLLFNDCSTYLILIIDVLFNYRRYQHFENIITKFKLANKDLNNVSMKISNRKVKYKKSVLIYCGLILLMKYTLVIIFDTLTYFVKFMDNPSEFFFFNIGHIFNFLNEIQLLSFELDVNKKYKILNKLLKVLCDDKNKIEEYDEIFGKLRSANFLLCDVQWEIDRMFGWFLLVKWFTAFNGLLEFPYNTVAGTSTVAGFIWSTAFLIDILWHLVCVELIKNQVNDFNLKYKVNKISNVKLDILTMFL